MTPAIDGLAPEELILVLEYFAGSDPDGFAVAAREARERYERADGYRNHPDEVIEGGVAGLRAEVRRQRLMRNAANAMTGVHKRRNERLKAELQHALGALAGDDEAMREFLADHQAKLTRWRDGSRMWQRIAEQGEAVIDAVHEEATKWAATRTPDGKVWGPPPADVPAAGRVLLDIIDRGTADNAPGTPLAAVRVEDLQTVLEARVRHWHQRPGIWDDDNAELAGTPCVECAARERLAKTAGHTTNEGNTA